MEEGQGRGAGGIAAGRIEWCDIYKGISISLVVLTHATFEFNRYLNQYIYQFVIAGLFFISGYTAGIRKRPFGEEAVRKFYKLMVPYYVLHFAGLWIFRVFEKAGILNAISTTRYTVSYGEALGKLLEGNNFIYCDWLGAMWFVPVLFGAEIIFTLLARVCRRDGLLCLASLLVFMGAEWVTARTAVTGIYFYSFDLAGIAQAFLVMGYMCHKVQEREERVWQLLLGAVLIGTAWWASIQLGFRYTFDWPTRNVNGPVDLLLPVYGILLTMTVSRLFAGNAPLKRLFVYLGQNSMGIMCFHFVGFKAAYLILILLGLMDAGEAYRLIPGPMMAKGWLLIFVMGIGVSLVLWRGLNRISFVRLLLGGENAGLVFKKLKVWIGRIRARLTKRFLTGAAMAAAAVLLLAAGLNLFRHSGRIAVSFPYEGNMVSFQGGWLPQGEGEDYRWMEGSARLKTILIGQNALEINGYIPDTVENISCIIIRINGNEAYREPAGPGQLIELRLGLKEYRKAFRRNTVEIEIDGVRIPGEEDVDQRRFSAFIRSVEIY